MKRSILHQQRKHLEVDLVRGQLGQHAKTPAGLQHLHPAARIPAHKRFVPVHAYSMQLLRPVLPGAEHEYGPSQPALLV